MKPRIRPRTEVGAWHAVADLVPLPDELTALYANLEHVTAEQAKLNAQPAEERTSAASAIVAGASAADALEAAVRDRIAQQARTDQQQALTDAVDLCSRNLTKYLAAHRDELIAGPLRTAVAAVLDQAEPLADALARFAGLSVPEVTSALLDGSTAAEVKAWARSRELTADLGRLHTAWSTSWGGATSTHGGRKADLHLRPGAPGGLHAWTDPTAVPDPEIRDGRNVDPLAIVRHRKAGGYRLASPAEIVELVRTVPVEQPWLPGERRARRVLLPRSA